MWNRRLPLLLLAISLVGCDNIREFRGEKVREFAVQHYLQNDFDKAMEASEAAIQLGSADASTYLVRGWIFVQRESFEMALEASDLAIEKALDPSFEGGNEWLVEGGNFLADARDLRADMLQILDRPAEAAAEMEILLSENPDAALYFNDLAWSLATNPDPAFRDGPRAVELATKANELSEWKDSAYLDTIAAAYAVTGNFEKAVEYQKQAVEKMNDGERSFGILIEREFEERVGLYERGEIYTENLKEEYLKRLRD